MKKLTILLGVLALSFANVWAQEEEKKAADKQKSIEEAKEKGELVKDTIDVPSPINNTTPLWAKPVKDCTEEEYKAFYRSLFNDFNEPISPNTFFSAFSLTQQVFNKIISAFS